MWHSGPLPRSIRNERGVVLLVVLIIAGIFAVLAYTALAVSIHWLDSTDAQRNKFVTRQVAEGAANDAAYRLLSDRGADAAAPGYLPPEETLSTAEDILMGRLIDASYSTPVQLETFPTTIEHMAYTVGTTQSTYAPDTDLIPGNRDNATYRYLSDDTFSQDYPGYEFAQVQTTGDLIVYGAGEVDPPGEEAGLFSFVRGDYPNIQFNYDMREAGVTEPSRMGPLPLIETEHPYGTNESRGWSVTYMNDPRHRGRHITGLRLMAEPDEVQIDVDATLYVSPWLENIKQFENPPPQAINAFANATNQVFTDEYKTNTIGLYFKSGDIPPSAGMNYGFRVSGVRYKFDSDSYDGHYETPHPYDYIIGPTDSDNLNMQVIYSPYQPSPLSPSAAIPSMSIQFDDRFSLDPVDRLYLFNASNPMSVAPVVVYSSASPPPVGGFAPTISPVNPSLPLGYILILYRSGSADTDGAPNYGYKVSAMEYTDANNDLRHVANPVIQTPHNVYFGANNTQYFLPVSLPFLPPMPYPAGPNMPGLQTIYQPAVPNTDDPTGRGTVSEWFVSFADSCDLAATSGAANEDRIRLTIVYNTPITGELTLNDTAYFVNPDGAYGSLIGTDPQYYDIADLKSLVVNCGKASALEIECYSDTVDAYQPNLQNFGFQVAQVGYLTDDGADDDMTPPTIRSDINFPSNDSYPSFGPGALQSTEWWYANHDALVVGLHFDRYNFDIEPGDRLEIYDDMGVLIATLLSDSISGGPEAGGPFNPDQPTGGPQPGLGPGVGGPKVPDGTVASTIVDLNATYGWVLVPGTTARVRLVGDGDDNEGYKGFEIDHCAYVNGDLTEIHNYVNEYAQVAYDQYYDRSAEPLERFRSLGVE